MTNTYAYPTQPIKWDR